MQSYAECVCDKCLQKKIKFLLLPNRFFPSFTIKRCVCTQMIDTVLSHTLIHTVKILIWENPRKELNLVLNNFFTSLLILQQTFMHVSSRCQRRNFIFVKRFNGSRKNKNNKACDGENFFQQTKIFSRVDFYGSLFAQDMSSDHR